MDNVITITIKEHLPERDRYRVSFESNPTIHELMAVKLLFEEVLDHNFDKIDQIQAAANIYPRFSDIEEIIDV